MRLKFNFSKNIEKVPNNLNVINSYIHKCLGVNNKYHDNKSDYNVSRLLSHGGFNLTDNGKYINYPNGGYILISSFNMEFFDKITMGIVKNNELGYGMKFTGIDVVEEEFYNGWNFFKTTKAGFIIKKRGERNQFITLNDDCFRDVLKERIINKFSKINKNLDFSDFKIEITEHPNHVVKSIYSNNVKNITNVCQLNIHTNRKVAKYLYTYGIGESCGSGFGTIYTAKKHEFYK